MNCDEGGGDAGQRQDADDHADQRAGDAHGQRLPRALGQAVAAEKERRPGPAEQEAAEHQQGHDTEDGGDSPFRKADAAMPSAIQKRTRSERRAERHWPSGPPRTTITVSARPTVPAKSGV